MARDAETAALLERLVTDPAFRTRFRNDPVAASREAGLETVADEMRLATGKAMTTLDGRESRSSLAGVLMAAAFEGAGAYDFSKGELPHIADIPDSVGKLVSRLELPAGATDPPAGGGAEELRPPAAVEPQGSG